MFASQFSLVSLTLLPILGMEDSGERLYHVTVLEELHNIFFVFFIYITSAYMPC